MSSRQIWVRELGSPVGIGGSAETDFEAAAKTFTIRVDFNSGSRFAVVGIDGPHPVHDTVTKRYRHLNFFQ